MCRIRISREIKEIKSIFKDVLFKTKIRIRIVENADLQHEAPGKLIMQNAFVWRFFFRISLATILEVIFFTLQQILWI